MTRHSLIVRIDNQTPDRLASQRVELTNSSNKMAAWGSNNIVISINVDQIYAIGCSTLELVMKSLIAAKSFIQSFSASVLP